MAGKPVGLLFVTSIFTGPQPPSAATTAGEATALKNLREEPQSSIPSSRVDIRLNRLFQRALGFENVLNCIAGSAVASG